METFVLQGRIELDSSSVAKSLENISSKVESTFANLGSKMSSVGKSLSSIGGKMTATVTTGLTALGAGAIKTSMDFEDAMAKVSTIADTSEMSLEQLKSAILNLSDQTGISAAEIADNVYNAISAGQKTGDAVNFVSNATKLATAGFTESGQALDVLSTIMNAYGLEASEVTNVSDMLIQTQNKGKTTVGELASTMGKVIPTANSYGVSLDQLCAGYALMTSNGIATAETTTYMNSMLNELGKSSTKVSGILRDQTGKSFAELIGSGMSLGDVLELLGDYADETGVSMGDLWGSAEAGKAALVLVKDGAKGFNSTLGEMQKSTGNTDIAFEKMQTTSYELKVAVNELKNILVELGDSLMNVAMPTIQKLIDGLKEFKSWFDGLDESTKEMIVQLGMFVAAVGPVLLVIGKVCTAIGSIITVGSKVFGGISKLIAVISGGGGLMASIGSVLSTVGGALMTALSSVGTFITGTLIPAIVAIAPEIAIVIAIVGALIAIGVLLYKNWEDIIAWGKKMGENIKKSWENMKENVSKAWENMKSSTKSAIDKMSDNISSFNSKAKEAMHNAWENIKEGCSSFWENIKTKYQEGSETLKTSVVDTFTNIKENTKDALKNLFDNVSESMSNIKEKWTSTLSSVDDFVNSTMEGMKQRFSDAWERITTNFHEATTKIKDSARENFTKVDEIVSEKVTKIKETAIEKWQAVKESVVEKLTQIKDDALEKWNEIKESTAAVVESVKQSTIEKFDNMKTAMKEKLSEISEFAKTTFNNFKQTVMEAVNKIWESISAAFAKVKNNFNEIKTMAINALSSIWKSLTEGFQKIKNHALEVVNNVKSLFNFDWKLPHIKLPHFRIDGEFSLSPPSIPHFSVDWYKNGGIMTDPTAFGFNPSTGNVMAGGEAGPEAILPIDNLREYIREELDNSEMLETMKSMLRTLNVYLPRQVDTLNNLNFSVNDREFARLVKGAI